MNIHDLFGGKRMTKKERREQRKRQLERLSNKAEMVRTSSIFKDKKSKIKMVKRIENSPKFQQDLRRMKDMLIKPQLKPTKPMMNGDFNVMKPKQDFLKSNTDMEVKGFDKQFKKKKDFMLL